MHPVLADLRADGGGRVLGSYGALAALAVFVACALSARAAHRAGMPLGAIAVVLAMVVAGGFAGAWTTFALVELARTGSPAFLAHGGGLVFFGAVPGGLCGAWIASKAGLAAGVAPARMLDLSIPAIACGHALGRIGCFLGGCCYGRVADLPWSIAYTHPLAPAADHLPRHPSPLYEAAGLLALAAVFALVPPRAPGRGARAAVYLACYAGLRLLVELTRGDAVRGIWAGGVSTSQALAALALAVAAAALARARGPR